MVVGRFLLRGCSHITSAKIRGSWTSPPPSSAMVSIYYNISSFFIEESHSISIPSSQFLLFLFFCHWVELSWGWDEGVELSLPEPINSPSHPRTAQAPHQKPVCPLKRATSPRETRRGGKSWKYLQFSSRAQLNGVGGEWQRTSDHLRPPTPRDSKSQHFNSRGKTNSANILNVR